ncbi:MAG: hypothetical protein K6G78_07695 [bacterium]|nr:hypothetical protein [bacterium]
MAKKNSALVTKLYRALSVVQSYAMATKISAIETASAIAGVLVGGIEIFANLGGDASEYSGLILIACGIAILVPFIRAFASIRTSRFGHTIQSSKMYHDDVQSRLKLSPNYIANGYEIRDFVDGGVTERYVASDLVDRSLIRGSFHPEQANPLYLDKGGYSIPDEVRPLAIGIISTILRKGKSKRLTNGKLTRQSTDLLPEDPSFKTCVVNKVRYFDGQCTHEIVYKQAPSKRSIDECFKGEALLMDESGELIELWRSRCANFMGASTIAITRDLKLILNVQGKQSMANAGRCAPSGSGSVEFSDCTLVLGRSANAMLPALITQAAERELHEECALKLGSSKMRSYLIGYARLLERGGKPDFFCVTFLDMSSQQLVSEYLGNISAGEMDLGTVPDPVDIADPLHPSQALARALAKRAADNPGQHSISIQLHILVHNLELFEATEEGRAALAQWAESGQLG